MYYITGFFFLLSPSRRLVTHPNLYQLDKSLGGGVAMNQKKTICTPPPQQSANASDRSRRWSEKEKKREKSGERT